MERLDDICAYKIQAMKTVYPDSRMETCRKCSGYDEFCMNYIQIRKTEIPLRTGRFAVLGDLL